VHSQRQAAQAYEFGNKVGIVSGGVKGRKIILAVKGFIDNVFDGHTIEPLLAQMQANGILFPASLPTTAAAKAEAR